MATENEEEEEATSEEDDKIAAVAAVLSCTNRYLCQMRIVLAQRE